MVEIVFKRVFMLREEDLQPKVQNSLQFMTTWRRVKRPLNSGTTESGPSPPALGSQEHGVYICDPKLTAALTIKT